MVLLYPASNHASMWLRKVLRFNNVKITVFFCFSAKRCANSLKNREKLEKTRGKTWDWNQSDRPPVKWQNNAYQDEFSKENENWSNRLRRRKCHPAPDGGLPGWVEIVVTVFACYNEHQWKRREVQRKNIRMVKLWIWKKYGQTVLCRESRTWLSTVSWLPAPGIRRNACWHSGLEWAEIPCGRQFNILWW